MNLSRLKGIMRERQVTYRECAESIGLSLSGFNNKMNGRTAFTIDELELVGEFLHMDGDEKKKIFLDDEEEGDGN